MTCSPLLFIGSPGWLEIILILAAILLIFGARKLPEIMGSFGKGIKEFKKEMNGVGREIESGGKGEESDLSHRKPAEPEDRPGEKPPDAGGS